MEYPSLYPIPQRQVPRREVPPADARLRDEVSRAADALEALGRHGALLGAEAAEIIERTVSDVRRRLARKDLAVVVVGEKKAGKSTFLNAILGARVLGAAVRECTGTVTLIRRAPRLAYRAALRGGASTAFQDREAAERTTIEREIGVLRQRVGPAGGGQPPPRPGGDLGEALARATATHDEARSRQLSAAAAARTLAAQHAEAAAAVQRLRAARDAAHEEAARREQVVASAGARLDAQRQQLSLLAGLSAGALVGQAAPVGRAARPDAETAAAAAALRVRVADAAVPFFLRPSPWWAIWAWLLRWILGWRYRPQIQALAEARDQHARAQHAVAVATAEDHITQIQEELTSETRLLQTARSELSDLGAHLLEAEALGAAVGERLTAARAAHAECQHEEDVARLRLLDLRREQLEAAALTRFRAEVRELTDMDLRGPEVLELMIEFPAAHLPEDITIIDTPGVNTDNATNRERAWDVIRREADGCILVSDMQQVVSSSTREFLQEVRTIIPHILLVMSKVDKALDNAGDVGGDDPWEQVEEARRVGLHRFAREVGRAPNEVFSIAVSAETALREGEGKDGFGRRFAGEIGKLFELLQSERAIVLGARAATALRYCVQRISDAQAQAEAKYQQRILELESQRVPDPRDFQKRQLAKVESLLLGHAEAIGKSARELMTEGVNGVQQQWIGAIQACTNKDQVKATVAQLGQGGQAAMSEVMARVEEAVRLWSGEAIKQMEDPLLEELRARYRIVQQMTTSGMAVQLGGIGAASVLSHATSLHAGVNSAVTNFEGEQFAIGAGGALAGAALGTMLLPGVGTAIGAAVGALAGLFKTLDSLKGDCIREVSKGLDDARKNLDLQLASTGPDVQRVMREILTQGLGDAVNRFQSWIGQLMAAERRQIDDERQKLSHLTRSRDALLGHDQTLAALQREVAAHSQGLCA